MPEALEKIERIRSYLAQFNPRAADLMAERLRAAGDSLDTFPDRGREGSQGTRELPAVPPYIIAYDVFDDRVEILSIRHGRQRPLES